MTTSADIGLPLISSQQASPEISHNESLVMLQALLTGVKQIGLNAPPGAPTEGDSYVIGAAPTGAWVGHSNAVAVWYSAGWRYVPGRDASGSIIPMGARQEGLRVWLQGAGVSPPTDALYRWSGSSWDLVTTAVSPHTHPEYAPRFYATGVVSGLEFTATPGGTAFDIAAGVARFVDDYTTPGTITYSDVTITAKTGVTDSYLSGSATYVGVNAANTVVQQATEFTQDQLRTICQICVIAHKSSTILTSAGLYVTAYNGDQLALDGFVAIGAIVNGGAYAGNSGLTFKRAAASIFRRGAEYLVDKVTPNSAALAAQDPCQFSVYAGDGGSGYTNSAIGTTVTPGFYDAGTGSTNGIPIGVVASNKWQALRVWVSTNGYTLLQYGRAIYNSSKEALDGAPSEAFVAAPITNLVPFRGYMLLRGGATALSSSADCIFVDAGKFGDRSVTSTSSVSPLSRELITADRTYYVRTDGNDNNLGLVDSASGAFLTIQKAVDTVANLDFGIYNVTIQVRDGTYAAVALKPTVGSNRCSLVGNTTTPSNALVTTSTAAANAITVNAFARWNIRGFKVTTTGSAANGLSVSAFGGAFVNGVMEYGACIGAHIAGNRNAYAVITGSYSITGGAARHIDTSLSALFTIESAVTVTLTGTPAFSSQFISATGITMLRLFNSTWTGAATGQRYSVTSNSILDTGGQATTWLPGDVAGTTATGGQYI